jgi:hypothetical protein
MLVIMVIQRQTIKGWLLVLLTIIAIAGQQGAALMETSD